ncbi:transposase [Mycobacterium nebraskense]|uniref:transposase n=1 Tax=Mycobacterium nebraskense TaxID=244292 RepID=UPI0035576CC6|nr:transposase [Mycobacterium nebraskense]
MARRRHTPEQVVRKLREGERLLGEGKDLGEVCRHLEVSEQTWHRWRNQYGGMKAEDTKRRGEGKVGEVCRHLEVSEQTWHRWRNQYGGMKAEDTKRLKELERENQRLKKLVAEQALDIDMLKEMSRGNW